MDATAFVWCPFYLIGGQMMKVTIREQLKSKSPQKQIDKKKSDKLSESDLKYLMGTSRQTLTRGKGGAWRNGR